MKARVLVILAVLVVVVASSGSMVAAKNAVVPFKATYVTHPQPSRPAVDGILTLKYRPRAKRPTWARAPGTRKCGLIRIQFAHPWTQGTER